MISVDTPNSFGDYNSWNLHRYCLTNQNDYLVLPTKPEGDTNTEQLAVSPPFIYLTKQPTDMTNWYMNRIFSPNLLCKFHSQFETCWQIESLNSVYYYSLFRSILILSSYSGATCEFAAICYGKSIHLHFTACSSMRWTSRERQVNWSVTARYQIK